MIAHPGCISRFRCFLPSPFVKQKRFGVSALAPTPSLGFAHAGSAPASVRGAERCPQARLPSPMSDLIPLSAHGWTLGLDGSKHYLVHGFWRRHLSSLSFQLTVSKASHGKKEVWSSGVSEPLSASIESRIPGIHRGNVSRSNLMVSLVVHC